MGIFNKKIDAQKIVDGAMSGIDKLFFTNQEKAEQASKIVDAHAEFVKSTLNSSTISSKTRRYIAVCIVVVFLIILLGSAGVYLFNEDYAKFLLLMSKDDIGTLAFMVCGFYFGGYMVSNHFFKGFQGKKKGKKKEK